MWLIYKGLDTIRMRNDYRQFFIYDLQISAAKQSAQVPDMTTVVNVWQKMFVAKRTLAVRAGTATLLLGGVSIDLAKGYATLLVRLSDTKAPNSVYSNPPAGGFTEHHKAPSEGADLGCHIMVSLDPEKGFPDLYTCAIEKVTGLSADLVQRLLSKLLNYEWQATDFFTYPHPAGGKKADGSPKTEKCCPHVVLRGRASDKLANDLENGTLTGVALVQTYAHNPVAGAPYLTMQKAELKLDINRAAMPKLNIHASLMAVFKANSQNYPTAKISYKLPGGARQVSVELNAATGNPLNDLYVLSYEVNNVFPFLALSANAIVPHLVSAAEQQFLANRNV